MNKIICTHHFNNSWNIIILFLRQVPDITYNMKYSDILNYIAPVSWLNFTFIIVHGSCYPTARLLNRLFNTHIKSVEGNIFGFVTVLQSSDVCAADKPPNMKPTYLLGTIKKGAPLDILATDYVGPLPCTSSNR